MKRSVLLLVVFPSILIFLMVGCGLREKISEEDEVIATIDGSSVTLSEYRSAFEKLKSQLPDGDTLDPEGIRTLKMNMLNQLIEKKLLMTEAGKLGITVSEAEINDQINKIVGEYPDSDTFHSRMKEENIDIASWKNEIEYQIILDKLVRAVAGSDFTVTPEEIKQYYDDHLDQYNYPTRVRALQIMLETREQAQTILNEIKGGADFSELARTYSISPDSEKGGDLGFFSEDEMPPSFSVVFEMKPGELSDVVDSEYGFHLFKIIDRREAKMLSLDEATPEIEEKLSRLKSEEKYGAWFEQIRKNKKIEVNPSVLEKVKM